MNPESKRALGQISQIRGCSREEARHFCSRIQSHQEDWKSSHTDISGALQVLEARGESYSSRELARKAEKITGMGRESRRKDKSGSLSVTIDHPKIRMFEGPGEHEGFIDWIDRNASEGFVLNLAGEDSDPVMHSARCSRLRPDPKRDRTATSCVKLCSKDREVLRGKALNLAKSTIELCSHCEV